MIETKYIKNKVGEKLFVETFFDDELKNKSNTLQTIVFLHGITGCRKGRTPADNYFQVLANKFAERGFKVVLFDYSGHGDSEGNDFDVTLSKTLGELEQVFNLEVADKTKVSFLAFSYGAAVLAKFLEKHQEVKPNKIVLYSPCLYPNEQCFLSEKSIFGKDVVAANESGEINKNGYAVVGAKGFKLGAKMVEECKGFKPDFLSNFAKNTLVLSGKQDVILGDLKLTEDFCKEHSIKNIYLNASHSLYECIDDAFSLTIKFLKKK